MSGKNPSFSNYSSEHPRVPHALPKTSSPLPLLNPHRRHRHRHLLFLALLFLARLSMGRRSGVPSRLLQYVPPLVAVPFHRIPKTPLIIGGNKFGLTFSCKRFGGIEPFFRGSCTSACESPRLACTRAAAPHVLPRMLKLSLARARVLSLSPSRPLAPCPMQSTRCSWCPGAV